MLLNAAQGRDRDVLFEAHQQIAANATAGSAADGADQALLVVPDLSLSYAPANLPGTAAGRGALPMNQVQVRQAIASSTTAVTAGATNWFDWRLNVWRPVNGVATLQGAVAYQTLSVNTTTTQAVTAAMQNTQAVITVTSTAGIRSGAQLLIDTGANAEVITVSAVVVGTSITALCTKTHLTGVALVSSLSALTPMSFVSAAGGVAAAATLPAITAGSNVVVTPNAVNGLPGILGIHVGDKLLVDTVASGVQETVTVTAVSGIWAGTFTATYANSHGASAPVVTSFLANQGPSAVFALKAGDVLSIARVSNNVTGLASPQALIEVDWSLAASQMGI